LIGKGGPAARKRKVGSCKSEREVARPLFEEIGPLSGLKAAQQLENRTRPQADPRKKAARPLFEGLQLLSCQKRGPTARKIILIQNDPARPLFARFRPLSGQKGVQEALTKSNNGGKSLHQNYFSA